ncbi:DUF4190 domain-containing protein [Pseudonocardia zijingensis]|jgi:hypothetical protein|uniref:DUF4190 domain-containing protein n=1 Tax=Pseudonocardia zijingensis TaxID=153376 RepID=A0ABN1N6W1_9PSEU
MSTPDSRPDGPQEGAGDQPTGPAYDPQQPAQSYDPLPGQAYDPRTGQPLGTPAPPYDTPQYGQQYGPPPGYGPQPTWYPPPGYGAHGPRPTNGLAIASLVLGILWLYWVGSILALVFGYIARRQIAERGESGDGIAVAGIVLGWIGVGVLALVFLLVIVGVAASGPYASF